MTKIIVQAAYMSGDMFGVAAALKLDRELYVLVVYDQTNTKQAGEMHKLYLASVKPSLDIDPGPIVIGSVTDKLATGHIYSPSLSIASPRVKLLEVPNSRAFYKSMHDKLPGSVANKSKVWKLFNLPTSTRIAAMGESTKTVVAQFGSQGEKKARNEIVENWRIFDFDDLGIARFLQRFGVTAATGSKYLFLWVRLSGRQGGAHIELDSGMTAWLQIIDALPDTITPILIGDRFDATLPAQPRKLVNLTKFWEEVPFCLYRHPKFTGAEERRSQFALFEYMLRADYKVCHLGMRSGVLESVALMGAPVVYMEETGNAQATRIAAMTEKMANYDRLVLRSLPTPEGQAIQRNASTVWADVRHPHIDKLRRHCDEDYETIKRRIGLLEQTVRVGSPLADYELAFVEAAMPSWEKKYAGVANWDAYVRANQKWYNKLHTLLEALYKRTWSTEGFADGFTRMDLESIMVKINAALP